MRPAWECVTGAVGASPANRNIVRVRRSLPPNGPTSCGQQFASFTQFHPQVLAALVEGSGLRMTTTNADRAVVMSKTNVNAKLFFTDPSYGSVDLGLE